jgi:hypothetical protein
MLQGGVQDTVGSADDQIAGSMETVLFAAEKQGDGQYPR